MFYSTTLEVVIHCNLVLISILISSLAPKLFQNSSLIPHSWSFSSIFCFVSFGGGGITGCGLYTAILWNLLRRLGSLGEKRAQEPECHSDEEWNWPQWSPCLSCLLGPFLLSPMNVFSWWQLSTKQAHKIAWPTPGIHGWVRQEFSLLLIQVPV